MKNFREMSGTDREEIYREDREREERERRRRAAARKAREAKRHGADILRTMYTAAR